LEYLQTRGLDYLSAWNMVLTAKQELQAVKFEDVNRTAVTFVSEVNRCLLQKELDTKLNPNCAKACSRTKRQPGNLAADSRPQDAVTHFRVEVFHRVVDQVTTCSIDERFFVNRQIIQDTACLDPRRFSELIDDGVPENSMEKLAQLTGMCASSLRSELLWFVRNCDMLRLCGMNLKQRCLTEMNFVQIVSVKKNVQ